MAKWMYQAVQEYNLSYNYQKYTNAQKYWQNYSVINLGTFDTFNIIFVRNMFCDKNKAVLMCIVSNFLLRYCSLILLGTKIFVLKLSIYYNTIRTYRMRIWVSFVPFPCPNEFTNWHQNDTKAVPLQAYRSKHNSMCSSLMMF